MKLRFRAGSLLWLLIAGLRRGYVPVTALRDLALIVSLEPR